MAKPRMDLSACVRKLLEEQDRDVLRAGIRVLSQALMEAEVAASIVAERHERTGDLTVHRNGSRTRRETQGSGRLNSRFPRWPGAATSPRCCNGAGGRSTGCSRWAS
jgi:putative transposase